MFQRLKLLRRLQEVKLSPNEAWALFERVKTHTSSAEDREQLAHLIRITLEGTDQLRTDQLRADPDVQTPPVSERPSSKPKGEAPPSVGQGCPAAPPSLMLSEPRNRL